MSTPSQPNYINKPPFMSSFTRHSLPAHQWVRSKAFYSLATFALLLVFVVFAAVNPTSYPVRSVASLGTHSRDFLRQHLPTEEVMQDREGWEDYGVLDNRPPNADPGPVQLKGIQSKYAFATFLVGSEKVINASDDHYYIATRLLTYQLLHAEETKSRNQTIPFLILVTDMVPQWQRDRFTKDGATVVPVPAVDPGWIKPGSTAWVHVMTKLRLYEFVQFERIAFLDVDTILAEPIDGVFDDPAVEEQETLPFEGHRIKGAIEEPKTYVFAGNPEHTKDHNFPPKEDGKDWPNIHYLNAGFFVIKPSVQMLEYYLSILKIPNSFNSDLPEQNLMNFVHRHDGNMPWLQLNSTWNVHYPNMKDIIGGAKSIHEKFWETDLRPIRLWMMARRWRMEGFFEAMDLAQKDDNS